MMQTIPKWKITWWYDRDLPNEMQSYINVNNMYEASKWFNQINHGLNSIIKVLFEVVNNDFKQEGASYK